eukprot:FR736966.1.p2 GENE.FR736966.1~~FR736966.1.p2  ORF type:complete len:118 (+),score=55.43 FR736966.1:686-1039(+)
MDGVPPWGMGGGFFGARQARCFLPGAARRLNSAREIPGAGNQKKKKLFPRLSLRVYKPPQKHHWRKAPKKPAPYPRKFFLLSPPGGGRGPKGVTGTPALLKKKNGGGEAPKTREKNK